MDPRGVTANQRKLFREDKTTTVMIELITLTCAKCKREFHKQKSMHAYGVRKGQTEFYCSHACVNVKPEGRPVIDLVCEACNKPFTRYLPAHQASQRNGQRQIFCSRLCVGKVKVKQRRQPHRRRPWSCSTSELNFLMKRNTPGKSWRSKTI